MRKLHDWYLEVTKLDQKMIVVKVADEHYIGRDEIQVYLEELSFFTSLTPSTWVSSVPIVCKWFNRFISKVSSSARSLPVINYAHYAIMQNEDWWMCPKRDLWHWVHPPNTNQCWVARELHQWNGEELAKVHKEPRLQKEDSVALQISVRVLLSSIS